MKKYLLLTTFGLLVMMAAFAVSNHFVSVASAVTEQHNDAAAVVAETSEAVEHSTEGAGTGTEAADTGLVGMFGLNWKLFLAQLINFAIVLFVLWKWVFKPVTKGLSDRTEKIEHSLEEAERIAKDRADFDSWKKGEISTVRTEATAIIAQAKQTAEELKASTLQATTEEQNRLVEQTKARLEQEKVLMIAQAKNELADVVVEATSKILKSKIDPAKDKELISDALKQAQ